MSQYIIFEGIVGTGKTTQSKKLYEYIKKNNPGMKVILTREPGGTEIAEAIRKIVQGSEFNEVMQAECEAYLYAASRAQSLRTVVKPILDKNGIVISDRSYLSSVAYQGAARSLGAKTVLEINKIAVNGILPSKIIYLDLSPETGLKRCFDKKGDKFEKEDIEFFNNVKLGYIELSKLPELKNKWSTIDATGSVEQVFQRIIQTLHSF